MPELPEVEVTRLSFVNAIESAAVLSVRVGRPLRWPLGCPPDQLVGRSVVTVDRRGKYLLVKFDDGYLLIHLGMSGSLRFAAELSAPGRHDHFDLVTDRGTLRLNDPRRFGAVVYCDSLATPVALKLLGKLGMEPLSEAFDLMSFQHGLSRRKSAIKNVLLAGDIVVGVGNIYASEVLFLAGIRPGCKAAGLSRPRQTRLYSAIKQVLQKAVSLGGSTLRDFSSAMGEAGHFQTDAMVYARAGLPCKVCATPIRMMRQAQRSTYFCPTCQTY